MARTYGLAFALLLAACDDYGNSVTFGSANDAGADVDVQEASVDAGVDSSITEVDATVPAPAFPYGLWQSAAPGLVAAVKRSQTGIIYCTNNDQTHDADAFARWGLGTWFNDLYFGMHGALYVFGEAQLKIFAKELRKIAAFIVPSTTNALVPYKVSADGTTAQYNADPGMDMDRAAMFVMMLARTYEMSGDLGLVRDLYPKANTVVEYLKARDLDGDLLPEGRTTFFLNGTGVGAGASISYIGDSVANTWKDFGAALFLYDAMTHLARMEDLIGMPAAAAGHRADAVALQAAAQSIFWNDATSGFLAWIEQDGTKHDDWITGNNLHAIDSGLASPAQATAILAMLQAHRADVEDVVPCRSRIGVFDAGLCSNSANYYWNGGAWTLLAAPDMLARASKGDLAGALHVADRLANHTESTEVGFYEAYDGVTAMTNGVYGQLMDNGGFLWGLFGGVFGLDTLGDEILVRATVPPEVLPTTAGWFYRGSNIEIDWVAAAVSSATLDGVPLTVTDGVYHLTNLPPAPRHRLVIAVAP